MPAIATVALVATSIAGLVAVFCSAMIYVATRREIWSAGRTIPRFFLTAILLGLSAGIAANAVLTHHTQAPWLSVALIALTFLRLIHDSAILRHRSETNDSNAALDHTAELLTGRLQNWHLVQGFAAIFGGLILPLVALAGFPSPATIVASLLLLLGAELIQRGLFFAAAASPRMPGVSHP